MDEKYGKGRTSFFIAGRAPRKVWKACFVWKTKLQGVGERQRGRLISRVHVWTRSMHRPRVWPVVQGCLKPLQLTVLWQ